MLVITRNLGDSFRIGDDIILTVANVKDGCSVKIGIDAPKEVTVLREEISSSRCGKQKLELC